MILNRSVTLLLSLCCFLQVEVNAKDNIFNECFKGKDAEGNDCIEMPEEDYFGRSFFQSMNTGAPSSSPAPTVEQTQPDLSRTSGNCTVDGTGRFGSTAVSDRVVVVYAYQLETVARTNVSAALSVLERAFNDELLPSLFEDQCGTDETKRKLRSQRRLTLIGISPSPKDVPMSNVNCTYAIKRSSDCSVVMGSLTVFHDGTTTSDTISSKTRAALKLAMTAGRFDRAHGGIERVTYLDVNSTDTSSSTSEGSENGGDSGSNNNAVIWGVVGGVLGVIFILLLCLWRKKLREERQEDESELLAPQPQPEFT